MVLHPQQLTHSAPTAKAPTLVLTIYYNQNNIPTLPRPPQRHISISMVMHPQQPTPPSTTATAPPLLFSGTAPTTTYPRCKDSYSANTIIKLVLHPQQHTHTAPTTRAQPQVLTWYCTHKNMPTLHRPLQRLNLY